MIYESQLAMIPYTPSVYVFFFLRITTVHDFISQPPRRHTINGPNIRRIISCIIRCSRTHNSPGKKRGGARRKEEREAIYGILGLCTGGILFCVCVCVVFVFKIPPETPLQPMFKS